MTTRRSIPSLGHGQLWWADLPGEKVRPVLILTRRRVAGRLTRVLVAPITSTVRGISTEVSVGEDEGVSAGSVVNFDNAQLIETDLLLRPIGSVPAERWPEFCLAMAAVLSC